MKNSVLLLGLGNILLRDEGVGVRVVEALRENFEFSEELTLLDGGTLGLDLLPYLEGKEKVLFIDAVDFRQGSGEVGFWEDEEVPSFLSPALSFHQIGLGDLLFASKLMGITPPKIVLMGIQPAVIETGLALSAPLKENFENILGAAMRKLREWGVEIKDKRTKGEDRVPGCSL